MALPLVANHHQPKSVLRASRAREHAWERYNEPFCWNSCLFRPALRTGPRAGPRADSGAATPAAAQTKTLTVFAAASMKNALDEVDAAYTAKTGVKLVASYAASSPVAEQIEQGAPADVFLSADTDWMDYATSKKKRPGIFHGERNLLGNSIVLIAPKYFKIDRVAIGPGFDLAKLAGDGKIATGDVEAVPVGKYAKASLEKLGSWPAAEPKFAMAESGARRCAGGARRGGARHRLFHRRQGRTRRQDRRRLPGGFPSAIIYPVAATTAAKPDAADYLAYLHRPRRCSRNMGLPT